MKTLRYLAAAALLASLQSISFAGTFGLHLGSVHIPKKDYTNVNPGMYYMHDSGVTVGIYRNSERRVSTYAGYTWEWGRFGLTAGAITGYRRAKVGPLVFPTMKVGDWRIGMLPKVERNGAFVVHFMYEWR